MYPEQLENHRQAGYLEVLWQDGTRQRLEHGLLRASCKCTVCQSQRLRGLAPVADGAVQLTALHAVGSYGVQCVFSDGHQKGIFPWVYLRTLGAAESAAVGG